MPKIVWVFTLWLLGMKRKEKCIRKAWPIAIWSVCLTEHINTRRVRLKRWNSKYIARSKWNSIDHVWRRSSCIWSKPSGLMIKRQKLRFMVKWLCATFTEEIWIWQVTLKRSTIWVSVKSQIQESECFTWDYGKTINATRSFSDRKLCKITRHCSTNSSWTLERLVCTRRMLDEGWLGVRFTQLILIIGARWAMRWAGLCLRS